MEHQESLAGTSERREKLKDQEHSLAALFSSRTPYVLLGAGHAGFICYLAAARRAQDSAFGFVDFHCDQTCRGHAVMLVENLDCKQNKPWEPDQHSPASALCCTSRQSPRVTPKTTALQNVVNRPNHFAIDASTVRPFDVLQSVIHPARISIKDAAATIAHRHTP